MKLFLIISWALTSFLAQITLHSASNSFKLNGIAGILSKDSIWLFFKVTLVSGASLVMTLVCYRYLTFFQFLVGQGLFYIFAFGYAFIKLGEVITIQKLIAISLFLPAIYLSLRST